jgi:hypothetical protein
MSDIAGRIGPTKLTDAQMELICLALNDLPHNYDLIVLECGDEVTDMDGFIEETWRRLLAMNATAESGKVG